MGEASGFGIELQELRTMAVICAALLPAFGWTAGAKNGRAMTVRAAVSGALLVGAVLLDVTVLRRRS